MSLVKAWSDPGIAEIELVPIGVCASWPDHAISCDQPACTGNAKIHAVLVSANWLLLIVYIGIYAMQLGGVSRLMAQ